MSRVVIKSARGRSYADSGYFSMTSSSLRFTDVPDLYTSKARLQWVGFNEKNFKMLFEHWQDQLPDDRTDFPMLHIFTRNTLRIACAKIAARMMAIGSGYAPSLASRMNYQMPFPIQDFGQIRST